MNLIKIGDTIINLDNVTQIEFFKGQAQITFLGEEHGLFSFDLSIDETEKLQRALDHFGVYVAT